MGNANVGGRAGAGRIPRAVVVCVLVGILLCLAFSPLAQADDPTYAVTISSVPDPIWTVTPSLTAAKAGDTVQVTVSDTAYTSWSTGLVVTGQSGTSYPFTTITAATGNANGVNGAGVYSFVMPSEPVSVGFTYDCTPLNIYVQLGSGAKTLVHSYTRSEMEEMAADNTDPIYYSMWSRVPAVFMGKAVRYVTIPQLVASAHTYNSAVRFDGSDCVMTGLSMDGWTTDLTWSYLLGVPRYYYAALGDPYLDPANQTGVDREVPPVLAITGWAGKQTYVDNQPYDTLNTYRLWYGLSAEQYGDGTTPTMAERDARCTANDQAKFVTELTFHVPQTYTVSTDSSITGGGLSVSPTSGIAGTTVTVIPNPDSGWQLVSGSLRYTTDGGATYTAIAATAGVYSFALPEADVVVTATFGNVSVPVTGVSLDKTTDKLAIGKGDQLVATITPGNAGNQTLSWSSSDPSVATVSSTGLVTAKAVGTATITATTADGGFSATCTVTVGAGGNDHFTIAILPDTQFYSQTYPQIFDEQTQWIADHKTSENIVFVAQTGDIINDYDSATEWQNAQGAMATIRSAGIPYVVVPGNHDLNLKVGDPTQFNTYFPVADFSGYAWYGGHYPTTSNTSSYQLFTALGQQFIVLDLVCSPSLLTSGTIDWANDVLDTYSGRKAIIITHGYVQPDGSLAGGDEVSGPTIRNNIVVYHQNVIAVICGHIDGEYHGTDTGVNGNTIYDLLTDYTSEPNGGDGWLRLYEFYPLENKVTALTYSPYLDAYQTDAQSQFDLTLAQDSHLVTFQSQGQTYTTQVAAIGSTIGAPTEPTRAGYNFAGWYSDEALTAPVIFPYTVTGDTTFYAKWEVVVPVTGVTLTKSSTTIVVGATEQLMATVSPADATNNNLTWSSSNTGVATVSTSGLVTGVASGTATITVTAADGGYTATCGLTVNDPAQPFNPLVQVIKLTASDKAANDYFGNPIAIDGDTAVVGACQADPDGISSAGAAYVYTRAGDGTWTQQAKLTASDKAANDYFGYSVAISGDTIVVGADYSDPSGVSNAGAAYVFTRSGSTWTQQAKLTASDKLAADYFGCSVAVDGDTAVVGAYYSDPNGVINAGAAYVFTRSDSSWTQQAKLVASDKQAYDCFGYSVAVDGDTAVIGAYQAAVDGTSLVGAAYVFTRSDSSWTQQRKLVASDRAYGDNFGCSVAISGDAAVIGAYNARPDGVVNAGAAYVFTRSNSSWTQQQKLVASDRAASDYFGKSVAISGSTVVVGANNADPDGVVNAGAAYVFGELKVSVTGVSLNKTGTTILLGGTERLIATVEPADATAKGVVWSSSNTAVASVTDTGLVTALSPGTATITAATVDRGLTATCVVTVELAMLPTVYLSSSGDNANYGATAQTAVLTFARAKELMANGGTIYICGTINVANTQTWDLSDKAGAIVQRAPGFTSSLVMVNSGGNLTLSNITIDGNTSSGQTGASLIYVNEVSNGAVTMNDGAVLQNNRSTNSLYAGGVRVAGGSLTMNGGCIINNTCTADGVGGVGVYASTATFTMNGGEIAGNTGGQGGGLYTASSNVTLSGGTIHDNTDISGLGGGIYVSGAGITPKIGPSANISGTVYLSAITDNLSITGALTNGLSIGSVTPSEGLVVANGLGYTLTETDRARFSYAGATWYCNRNTSTNAIYLTATPMVVAVTGVTLNKSSTTLEMGASEQLTATVSPAYATNKNLAWSSGNESAATVSASGLVTGVAAGTATITATTADGGYTAACVVTVNPNTVSLALQSGWNLVAAGTGTSFPATLFGWDGTTFVSTTSCANWQGYWCKPSTDQTVTMSVASGPHTTALAGGWNLIGNPMSSTAALTLPSGRVAFVYDPAGHTYVSTTSLAPGQGAWVKGTAGETVGFDLR